MMTARSQSLEVKNQLYQTYSDLNIFSRKLMLLTNSRSLLIPADIDLNRYGNNSPADSLLWRQNPSLGFAEHQVEISRLEKKLELSQMMPDFSIGYFSQTIFGTQEVNGVTRNFGNGYRFSGIQAGLALPLWLTPYTSRVKAARINEHIARTNADYFSRSAEVNFMNLLEELKKYQSTVEFYEKQAVPEAEIIVEQASRSYKAGALDYLEYVLTLNRALAVRQNYLDAINNYNQTNILIDNSEGKIF